MKFFERRSVTYAEDFVKALDNILTGSLIKFLSDREHGGARRPGRDGIFFRG